MTVLSNMRRRVTLMREERAQGAGGRLVTSTPIIADVWAVVEESAGSAEERADKQIFGGTARFSVRYCDPYRATRYISWRGARYRVTGTEATRTGTPTLVFSARLLEGELA